MTVPMAMRITIITTVTVVVSPFLLVGALTAGKRLSLFGPNLTNNRSAVGRVHF